MHCVENKTKAVRSLNKITHHKRQQADHKYHNHQNHVLNIKAETFSVITGK